MGLFCNGTNVRDPEVAEWKLSKPESISGSQRRATPEPELGCRDVLATENRLETSASVSVAAYPIGKGSNPGRQWAVRKKSDAEVQARKRK